MPAVSGRHYNRQFIAPMKQYTDQEITAVVKGYLLEKIDIRDLPEEEDIFASGLVNSLFAIELMTFLESQFTVKITMDDLDMEHFKSVHAIRIFLKGKLAAA